MKGTVRKMIQKTQNASIFKIESKYIDILSMGSFERELESILSTTTRNIFLDFSEVEEVSSAVLGILIHKKVKMKNKGIEIYLLNTSKSIERILKILKLTSLLLSSNTIDAENFYAKAV